MAIHVVYTTPMPVLNGVVLDKNKATIAEMMNADMEIRILESSDVPNSTGNPNIETYLGLENDDGFGVKEIANTMIITES